MEYYTYSETAKYKGVTETEPDNLLWTLTPYVDSFEDPEWDGEKWIEAAEFNIQTYSEKINELHNALFEQMYKAKNYLTIGEISLWITDLEYGEEAANLILWWRNSCRAVETHLATANEASPSPEEFIQTLLV